MTTVKLLNALDLKSRLKKIKPFMSTDETRYYLKGVYFEYNNGQLRATATNGHILCTMEWALEEQEDHSPFSFILPAQAVNNLIKIIAAKGEGVLLNVDDNVIEFDFFDFKYRTVAVDGSYPNYSEVIPKGEISLQKGMNASYLQAVLTALDNEPVNIEVDNGDQSSQAHLFSSTTDGVRCVIMPTRI